MQGIARNRTICPCWLWALFPLLLVAVLIIPRLGDIAYNGDEIDSVIPVAGANQPGPLSLADSLINVSPDQALGWPVLLFIWGRIAGWSEVAVRALPFLAGLLAHAVVYRAGRDLFRRKQVFSPYCFLRPRCFRKPICFTHAPSRWCCSSLRCASGPGGVSPCDRNRQDDAHRQACCWAQPACYFRIIWLRCCCPSSVCSTCSSPPGNGIGGAPSSWSGWPS